VPEETEQANQKEEQATWIGPLSGRLSVIELRAAVAHNEAVISARTAATVAAAEAAAREAAEAAREATVEGAVEASPEEVVAVSGVAVAGAEGS
jgi:hypothetical protein